MSSVDTGATDRWLALTRSSLTPPLSDEDTTPRLKSKPPQSNRLADVESSTRRKTSRKAVPPGGHLSTGNRASLRRRTTSENIPDKSIRSRSKSTDRLASRLKASISRKKVDSKPNSSSDRTLTAEEQPAHGLTELRSDANVAHNSAMSFEVLYTTPVVVPSNPPPVDYSRKDIEKIWSVTPDMTLEQASTVTKDEFKAWPSPLQDLSLNSGSSLPPTVPPPTLLTPSGDTLNKANASGAIATQSSYVQLPASELATQFSFYQEPHFEVWDMPDDGYIHWPAQINLVVKNIGKWAFKPLTLPDIRMIDIQCYTKAKLSIYSEFDPEAYHSVHYTGAKLEDEHGKPLPLMHQNGITVEPEWVRSYGKTIGKGSKPNERGIGIGKRGWYLKIWVPIPMSLFKKMETRTFILRAGVWIGDDEGDIVECDTEMTISHLRKKREMI